LNDQIQTCHPQFNYQNPAHGNQLVLTSLSDTGWCYKRSWHKNYAHTLRNKLIKEKGATVLEYLKAV
jgi:hypothetical protein